MRLDARTVNMSAIKRFARIVVTITKKERRAFEGSAIVRPAS
jgi:hypothetical protein